MDTFYIETYGCQMNFAQSSQIRALLQREGYQASEDEHETQIVIINACSVREHAEQKVFQRIQYFQSLKKKKKLLLLVVGCFAQNQQERIHADFILGPSRLHTLPRIIQDGLEGKYLDVEMQGHVFLDPANEEKHPFRAMIDIMKGCDHFCTYCIVPFVRGKQVSRISMDVLGEIKELTDNGVKEIILLGQNINNYGKDSHDISFAELLFRVNALSGVKRIRFLTSHPKDFTQDIIDSVFQNEKVCPSFHLPLQSGSDRVLKMMNRNYTKEKYLGIIDRIRSHKKEYSLSTDFLVGFPGETEKDYLETVEMARTVGFNQAFLFKYSPRPRTAASRLEDPVGEQVKLERLDHLIKIQKDIEKEKIKDNLDKIRTVLVEDESRKEKQKFSGRDELNYTVIVPGPVARGEFYQVRVGQIRGITLLGDVI